MFFKNKMNKNRNTIESNSHAISFSSPIEFPPPNRSVIINITARQIVQINFKNNSNVLQTKPPFMIEANIVASENIGSGKSEYSSAICPFRLYILAIVLNLS